MKKILIFISCVLCLGLFIGCGSNKSSVTMDETDSSSQIKPSAEIAEDNSGFSDDLSATLDEGTNVYYSNDNRKIINNADLTIETTEFTEAINSLETITADLNGYIESSNIFQQGINSSSYNKNRSGEFVVRIPKENFQNFLSDSSKFGVVTNKRVYGEDITTQYYDREARLKVLKAQEERYLEILKEAKDIEQVLEVEKYLTEVRYEIETITGSLKQMDNLVNYSTFNISIYEVIKVSEAKKVPTTLGEKIAKVFLDSINSLNAVGTGIILVLIAIIPYSVIIAIIILIVYLIIKNIKKSKKNRKE